MAAIRPDPDDDDERPAWRDADSDDDEPKDWDIEPEEEREDKRPVLGGTEPIARLLFIAILGCVIVGGLIAFVLAVLNWIRR